MYFKQIKTYPHLIYSSLHLRWLPSPNLSSRDIVLHSCSRSRCHRSLLILSITPIYSLSISKSNSELASRFTALISPASDLRQKCFWASSPFFLFSSFPCLALQFHLCLEHFPAWSTETDRESESALWTVGHGTWRTTKSISHYYSNNWLSILHSGYFHLTVLTPL